MIAQAIKDIPSGKNSRVIIESELEDAIREVINSLVSNGLLDLDVIYYASRGDELFDVQDLITCKDGMLHVVHQPSDRDNKCYETEGDMSLDNYLSRMKFPESITFIDMGYLLESDAIYRKGTITLNRFQKVLSPMTKVQLSAFHSETIARVKNYVMIEVQPTT